MKLNVTHFGSNIGFDKIIEVDEAEKKLESTARSAS